MWGPHLPIFAARVLLTLLFGFPFVHTDYISNEKPVNGGPMGASAITDWSFNSFQGPFEKGALEHVAGSLWATEDERAPLG